MSDYLIDLLKQFIIIGGLGYFNYFYFHKIGVINRDHNTEDKYFFLVLFSVINLFLYEYLSIFILDIFECAFNLKYELESFIWARLFVAILLVLIANKLVKFIILYLYVCINKLRSRENLGHINTKTVHDSFFDQKGVQEMYIFDLFTNNLLSCGHLFAMDEKNKDKDFDLILVPFSQEWEKTAPKDYKTLKNECMNPNVNSKEYINVTKGIKIITIYYESII